MKKLKISLPLYKIFCALFYITILAIIRGVSSMNEVGQTIDSYTALLALILCADTCYQEIPGCRWEILALKPKKRQMGDVLSRLAIQYLFLTGTAAVGYVLFCWIQKPYSAGNDIALFLTTIGGTAAGILMFGALSPCLVKLTGSLLGGAGASAALWFFLISSNAEKLPVFLQVFSFEGRPWGEGSLSWLYGKGTALAVGAVCLWAVRHFNGPGHIIWPRTWPAGKKKESR